MNPAAAKLALKVMTENEATQAASQPALAFDRPEALEISDARAQFLDWSLASWPGPSLITALDAGTGAGFFAGRLSECHGLKVSATDARTENVLEARRRYPSVEFFAADVEDPAIVARGQFDVVTAFGLLYHLENPFRAIRNLSAMARHALILESLIAPGKEVQAMLLDEFAGEDQGLNYVAWHLTESAIAKLLYCSGIAHVYRVRFRPPGRQFRGNLIYRRTRAFLIGSRVPLNTQQFDRFPEPVHRLDRAYYSRSPWRLLLKPVLQWRRKRLENLSASRTENQDVLDPGEAKVSRQKNPREISE